MLLLMFLLDIAVVFFRLFFLVEQYFLFFNDIIEKVFFCFRFLFDDGKEILDFEVFVKWIFFKFIDIFRLFFNRGELEILGICLVRFFFMLLSLDIKLRVFDTGLVSEFCGRDFDFGFIVLFEKFVFIELELI